MGSTHTATAILRLLSGMGFSTYFVIRNKKIMFIAFAGKTDKRIYLIPLKRAGGGFPIGQIYLSETGDPSVQVWYTGYVPADRISNRVIHRFLDTEEKCARTNICESGSYIHDPSIYQSVFHLWLKQEDYEIIEVFAHCSDNVQLR